jgi:hypothetical protein
LFQMFLEEKNSGKIDFPQVWGVNIE